MKQPVWVLREVVLLAHEQSLAQFGGAAGELSEAAYAEWLKANSKRSRGSHQA
jgi:hypothetical protein